VVRKIFEVKHTIAAAAAAAAASIFPAVSASTAVAAAAQGVSNASNDHSTPVHAACSRHRSRSSRTTAVPSRSVTDAVTNAAF
jgi:hypothetical protein